MASTCGMWLTRFQDRSSVSTKTKFGRGLARVADAARAFGWVAVVDVHPAAARIASRTAATARMGLKVIAPSRPNPGHRSHRFPEPTDPHAPRHATHTSSYSGAADG